MTTFGYIYENSINNFTVIINQSLITWPDYFNNQLPRYKYYQQIKDIKRSITIWFIFAITVSGIFALFGCLLTSFLCGKIKIGWNICSIIGYIFINNYYMFI